MKIKPIEYYYQYLCTSDPRSTFPDGEPLFMDVMWEYDLKDDYESLDEYTKQFNERVVDNKVTDCSCDNCFYGHDQWARETIELINYVHELEGR